MGRDENIAIFLDTEQMCREHPVLRNSVSESIKNQTLLLENDLLPEVNKMIYEEPAKLVVSKKRSYEAAFGYRGKTVCVHNFASASNPGGGVVHGSSAQEECLCRCSTLYFCINTREMWDGFYSPHRMEQNPLHNDDLIYTPNVTVFKSDTAYPKTMRETDWYHVNVITCAAPNLREKPSNRYNSGDGPVSVRISDRDLLTLHEKRLRRILDVAVIEGNEAVVLGAFGCGAFMNNPEVVAQAARNVIKDYLYAFQTIEFAIYCSPRDERNYLCFERNLRQLSQNASDALTKLG